MGHACIQTIRNGSFTGTFICSGNDCKFRGSLSEAVEHCIKNQFIVDARLKDTNPVIGGGNSIPPEYREQYQKLIAPNRTHTPVRKFGLRDR